MNIINVIKYNQINNLPYLVAFFLNNKKKKQRPNITQRNDRVTKQIRV